jgi:hypothetical protein
MHSATAVGRFAGSQNIFPNAFLGFAALHPRLYAAGRFADFLQLSAPHHFSLAFALKLADDAQYKAELALSPTQLRRVDFYR